MNEAIVHERIQNTTDCRNNYQLYYNKMLLSHQALKSNILCLLEQLDSN